MLMRQSSAVGSDGKRARNPARHRMVLFELASEDGARHGTSSEEVRDTR